MQFVGSSTLYYCRYAFLLTCEVVSATHVAAVDASGIFFYPVHLFVQSSDDPRGKRLSFTSSLHSRTVLSTSCPSIVTCPVARRREKNIKRYRGYSVTFSDRITGMSRHSAAQCLAATMRQISHESTSQYSKFADWTESSRL